MWYQYTQEDVMKELRKLEFTIEEYLNHPSTVLERFMAVVKNQNLSQRDVQQYLEGRCRQMMMDSFRWEVLIVPIIGTGLLSCHVAGHKEDFFVKVSPRHMTVSLHREGKLLEKDSRLDQTSSAIFTESPYDVSPISEYGLQKAKSLAVDLYYGK
jgi:hypothetical protein